MNSNSSANKNSFIDKVNSNLSEKQRSILKKLWSILTYKWQWQIILNTPFLVIWILDQTIPAIHSFDMQLISSLPIPMKIKTLLGFS